MLNHNATLYLAWGYEHSFDKESYTSYSISREVYATEDRLFCKRCSEMDIQLSDELFRKGVIIPAAA